MPILLASCYVLLGAAIVAVETRRVTSGQPFNALSLFNGAYFLFFVFFPLNLLEFGELAVRQKYAYQTWAHGDIRTALVLLFTYALFVLGYYRHHGRSLEATTRYRVELLGSRLPLRLVWAFSAIGALALAYHVSLMGGVLETLYFSPGARTGEYKLEGRFLFVRQFCSFVATAFMIYWALYVGMSSKKLSGGSLRGWWLPHLGIALLGGAFVFYALSTYGRREFLYPMAICLIVWIFGNRNRSWAKLGWLAIFFMVWFWLYSWAIPAAALAAEALPVGNFLVTAYFKTVQGLGDTFMHFVASQHAELWQFGFLKDLWELPAQFLPSKLLGFDRGRGMYGETSAFILGHPLTQGLSGEEPLGLHGYLLVNFGYVGLFVLFYLAGVGYCLVDRTLRPSPGGNALGWLVFMWVTIGAMEFLREGALVLILKPRFSWWLAIGILLWCEARSMVKKHDFLTSRYSKI